MLATSEQELTASYDDSVWTVGGDYNFVNFRIEGPVLHLTVEVMTRSSLRKEFEWLNIQYPDFKKKLADVIEVRVTRDQLSNQLTLHACRIVLGDFGHCKASGKASESCEFKNLFALKEGFPVVAYKRALREVGDVRTSLLFLWCAKRFLHTGCLARPFRCFRDERFRIR